MLGLSVFIRESKPTTDDRSLTFSTEPVKVLEFELTEIPGQLKPRKILVPRLGIELEVKESEVKGGYWEVFESSAGWGKGSSPPGYNGNQVIFAHAREGLFDNLDKIRIEDNVYVFNEKEWFSYRVSEIKEVYPGETEVIQKTEDERLTLYTCSGYRDQKRLVVIAKRN